jgi:hypothetical protein
MTNAVFAGSVVPDFSTTFHLLGPFKGLGIIDNEEHQQMRLFLFDNLHHQNSLNRSV